MKRLLLTFLLLIPMAIAIGACGSDDADTASVAEPAAAPSGPTVVASTAWTGALAKAAGAGTVTLIAPASFQHPPDYEPKPSDLAAVAKADFVVLAEYDGFAKQLRDATGSAAQGAGLEGRATAKASHVNYPPGLDLLEVFRQNAVSIRTAAG